MQVKYIPGEEEVSQTMTCSNKDIHQEIDGSRRAYTEELDSLMIG